MAARRPRPVASLVAEAEDPGTTTARLAQLARHPSATARQAVAESPAIEDDTLMLLARDARELVRAIAAVGARGRPGVEHELATSPHRWVRAILADAYARDPERSLLRETQAVLARDTFRKVRVRTAGTTSYRDLFDLLLHDPDPHVRGACAANPRATRADVDHLLGDRARIARGTAVAAGLHYPDEEQLLRTAADRSVDVRWAVPLRAGRWHEVARLLADDPDEIVRRHARGVLDGREIVSEQVEDFGRSERRLFPRRDFDA